MTIPCTVIVAILLPGLISPPYVDIFSFWYMFLLTSCILVSSNYCPKLMKPHLLWGCNRHFHCLWKSFECSRGKWHKTFRQKLSLSVILAWCPMLPSGVYLTAARLSKIACLGDKISTSLWDFGRFNSLHELGLFIFLVTNDWSSGLCPAEILVFGPSQSFHFTRYSFSPFSPRSSCMSSTSHNF